MLLHILLILIVIGIIVMLLAFTTESFPLFVFSSFLFSAIAGLSMMIQIPYSDGSILVFSDDNSRVFFLLMGSLSAFLAILYKFQKLPEESEEGSP